MLWIWSEELNVVIFCVVDFTHSSEAEPCVYKLLRTNSSSCYSEPQRLQLQNSLNWTLNNE